MSYMSFLYVCACVSTIEVNLGCPSSEVVHPGFVTVVSKACLIGRLAIEPQRSSYRCLLTAETVSTHYCARLSLVYVGSGDQNLAYGLSSLLSSTVFSWSSKCLQIFEQ